MKTKIMLVVLFTVCVSFYGFYQMKHQNPVPKCFTNYTLILQDLGVGESSCVYRINYGYYKSHIDTTFSQGTNVTIDAISCVRGNDGDFYFFHYWSDNVTTNPRVITMNSDITLSGVYKNKQEMQLGIE